MKFLKVIKKALFKCGITEFVVIPACPESFLRKTFYFGEIEEGFTTSRNDRT